MKYKIILGLVALSFLLSFGCKMDRYTIVQIPVPSKNAIDFLKYKKIFYTPFEITGTPEGFTPEKEVNSFFLNEFPKVIGKNIEGPVNPGDNQSLLKGSLIISGKISLSINRRSLIDTEKRRRTKRKIFKKVENWEMKIEFYFTDKGSDKPLFKKVLESKLNSANPKRPDYNFKFLFRKITENFIRRVMRVGKRETRFLLKK